ncbi:MAG: hypothetical protein ACLS37_12505 [Alistipes sp.]
MTLILTIYCAVTAALAFALMAAAGIEAARRRREQWGNAVRYLRLVLLALARAIRRREQSVFRTAASSPACSRRCLAACRFDLRAGQQTLRRIVRENGLESYLLRRIRRTRGYRRAYYLLLLSRLPLEAQTDAAVARYTASRNPYVSFYALMTRLAFDPTMALRLVGEFARPFTVYEVSEVMATLRRGVLPVAYEPLLDSSDRNLRIVGLNIVRQFGIEEAERQLLGIVRNGPQETRANRLYALRAAPTARAAQVAFVQGMNGRPQGSCCAAWPARGIPPVRSGALAGA